MAESEPQLEEEVAPLCQVLPCWQGSSQLTLFASRREEEGEEGGR